MSGPVYCASAPAIVAAGEAYVAVAREPDAKPSTAVAEALIAAHHPSLGLDRSVCASDVADFYQRTIRATTKPPTLSALLEHLDPERKS